MEIGGEFGGGGKVSENGQLDLETISELYTTPEVKKNLMDPPLGVP